MKLLSLVVSLITAWTMIHGVPAYGESEIWYETIISDPESIKITEGKSVTFELPTFNSDLGTLIDAEVNVSIKYMRLEAWIMPMWCTWFHDPYIDYVKSQIDWRADVSVRTGDDKLVNLIEWYDDENRSIAVLEAHEWPKPLSDEGKKQYNIGVCNPNLVKFYYRSFIFKGPDDPSCCENQSIKEGETWDAFHSMGPSYPCCENCSQKPRAIGPVWNYEIWLNELKKPENYLKVKVSITDSQKTYRIYACSGWEEDKGAEKKRLTDHEISGELSASVTYWYEPVSSPSM